MSAIDAFTAIAVVAVALYVGQESPALTVAIVAITGCLGVTRVLWQGGAPPHTGAQAGPPGAAQLDRWLSHLTPPLARYAYARPRELQVGVYVLLLVTAGISVLFGSALPLAGAAVFLPAASVAIVLVWYAFLGAPVEYWLYDTHVALVDGHQYERWPFHQVARVRIPHHPARGSPHLEWEDDAGRRVGITHAACAERVRATLDRDVYPTLAARTQAHLANGVTVGLDPPTAHGHTLLLALTASVILAIASAVLYAELDRDSLIDRWMGLDHRAWVIHKDLATLALCGTLVAVVMGSRWNTKRVTLTRAGVGGQDGLRFIAWRDVRHTSTGATHCVVHGPDTEIQVDLRTWNAVLVPRLAELMARDPATDGTPNETRP